MNGREVSKRNWEFDADLGTSHEAISAGSLQRIADACELMAKSWREPMEQRDRYRDMLHEANSALSGRDRQIAALKGQIAKLKRKLESGAK